MKDVHLEDDEVLVSFDVVALFTNTPIPETLDIVRSRLENDKTLKNRTRLTVDDIIELLGLVLNTTYFVFRGQIYKQKFGAAMGSPVSPIIANLFMEDLEQKAIATAPDHCKPKFWKRYVDDVASAVKRGQSENLKDHLNTIDPTDSIKFTYEEETNGCMPFLDTLMKHEDDGSISFTVYRKPTHTDQYLNFKSHHPLHQKLGVVRTLLDRCETVVTKKEDKVAEFQHIEQALSTCGYPRWTVNRVAEKMSANKTKSKQGKRPEKSEKSRGMVVIPYVAGLSESFERVMRKHKIATAMKPHTTMKQLLVHPKDKAEIGEVGQIVYEIPCQSCDASYVGETGRLFKNRLHEHKSEADNVAESKRFTRSERKKSETITNKSAITDHMSRNNHIIDWEGAKMKCREAHRGTRLVKEVIWIKRT